MSLELPKRIFKEGEEPQVTQNNNNCRIEYIMRKFTQWMPKELEAVKKDPIFFLRSLSSIRMVLGSPREWIVKAVAPPERQK
ncbi:hypothetical protein F2Q68_00007740 [Brassica cretica]|uniref:Uncharacterized protein n=1 Tax=Brassica cretica TaxID=69181 RepID=A0A8S9L4F3_BRACR|nr:hypothetical protein F2Q68_00007740 [Brassica cretica]